MKCKIFKLTVEYIIPTIYFKRLEGINEIFSHNICNWHHFMTYSTPIYYDKGDITLFEFFKAYNESSVFGLTAIFNINGNFVQNNYTPSLSELYIELNIRDLISSNDSTLDSQISDENNILRGRNFMRLNIDRSNHNNPVIKTKIEELFKLFELEEIKLDEISPNSWYSVIWIPHKNNKTTFVVYYKFRGNNFTNSFKFIQVVGCYTNKLEDEPFWFSNHINTANFYNDFYHNKNMFNLFNVIFFNLGICL
jgi:hypothetical protein